jgi:O-methyltransferase
MTNPPAADETWSFPEHPDIIHQKIFPKATYSPWLSDATFLECYIRVSQHTIVDIYRCYELWSLVKHLKNNVDGCILEVGVYRGGTGGLLASAAKKYAPKRQVFLADTFEGMVKVSDKDPLYKGGEHSDTSVELVAGLLASMLLTNVRMLKGVFPNDTGQHIKQNIALLHCDVDVYESAKDIVEWALPKMQSGSVIVFDDYGFSGCEGITRFVHELRERDDFFFMHNLNGHAVFVKR